MRELRQGHALRAKVVHAFAGVATISSGLVLPTLVTRVGPVGNPWWIWSWHQHVMHVAEGLLRGWRPAGLANVVLAGGAGPSSKVGTGCLVANVTREGIRHVSSSINGPAQGVPTGAVFSDPRRKADEANIILARKACPASARAGARLVATIARVRAGHVATPVGGVYQWMVACTTSHKA